MPRLLPKPVQFPGVCVRCESSIEERGPYLDTDIIDPLDRRLYFCASCTGELVRPLEIVPASKLKDALDTIERLRSVEHVAAQHAADLEIEKARADELAGRLAVALSRVSAFERTVKELEGRVAKERKAALLADVAPIEPKSKRKVAA